jgi:hypothetical protein
MGELTDFVNKNIPKVKGFYGELLVSLINCFNYVDIEIIMPHRTGQKLVMLAHIVHLRCLKKCV